MNARKRMLDREYHEAKRLRLRLEGLTFMGTPRRLKLWPLHLFIGHSDPAGKKLIRQRTTRQANLAAGLRYDGKPRQRKRWSELDGLSPRERVNRRQAIMRRQKRQENGFTPIERAWREFRSTIVIPIVQPLAWGEREANDRHQL